MKRQITRIRDVMKTNFDMVDGLATVADALKTMIHVETKTLIVQKRHDDDEFGVVTLADIGRKVLAQDKALDRVNIYEIMTKPVMHVHPEMDIRYAARLFDTLRLTRSPVITNGEVVGIVSMTDMVIKGLLREIED